jgi:hypothetical protein
LTSTTPSKKVTTNTYIKGSFLGADLILITAYESEPGSSTRIYEGKIAQESTISLLSLASEVFSDGIELPSELPDIELFDITVRLVSTKDGDKSSTSDFEFSGKSRLSFGEKFSFSGITITPPPEVIFDFKIAQAKDGNDTTKNFFLGMSLRQGNALEVSSALAWTRNLPGTDAIFREIQKDDEDESGSDSLVSLTLTALEDISIILIKTTLSSTKDKTQNNSNKTPTGAAEYFNGFNPSKWELSFKFLDEEFKLNFGQTSAILNSANDESPSSAATRAFVSSSAADVTPAEATTPALPRAAITVVRAAVPTSASAEGTDSRTSSASTAATATSKNGKKREFTFPFLKQGSKNSTDNDTSNGASSESKGSILSQISQRITIRPPSTESLKMEGSIISISIPGTIHIGSMDLDIELPVDFDIERFAINIDPKKFEGIKVFSKNEQLPKKSLLGLEWSFFGAKVEGKEPRYHHLTLVTKDFNYQLQQAPGARIEIAYTKASQDPIVFIISNFVLGAKGLTITAEVSDRPARLNGIDTKYRFNGSRLSIVENRIQDFTLSGSGPLPPKLVGDAMVDVALQFKQVDGGLKLVAGAAQMRGNKILDCKGTRFQFSVDAIGLKFVNDEQFHLYFTLTGQARFVLGKGDSRNSALAMLPNIQIDLIDCPLTGDARVIAKHVRFLVELPKPVSFPFLGAYEFELRAIGFLPGFKPFDNDVAMQITGQIKFAQGKGDAATNKPDYHSLYIGLPKPGSFEPRLYMDKLPLDITAGEAFKLNGVVEFKDTNVLKGFEGEGVLEIKGLPPVAASFGFYRTRKSEADPWVRAWFIYLEVRQVSFRIPVVEFYIREVGLGFGYRYTLVGIKRADESGSLKELLAELKVLSRTQGDLSRRDRWSIDLEDRGQDPRWTIVLRAMIAQLSAAPSPLSWNKAKEEQLACVYLFDAVIAFRSDLTFFMNVRGWLNTSYGMYVKERNDGNSLEPLFSGFVFLWPRQKRFLAHLASNPNGHLGSKPPLPKFVESAIRNGQFSATLLIEPGLMHFELGWPNMLRWSNSLGPLQADLRGGFIFRISSTELVLGVSFLARASLKISTQISMGLVGASIEADASVAYGARYIGLVEFKSGTPYIYGAIGLEIRIKVVVALWIKIPLLFKTIKKSFNLRFEINFTAGLEFALNGDKPGLRGYGTIAVRAMGHQLQFNVRFNADENQVNAAKQRTEKYLNIGLEATEVESVPGIEADPPTLRAAAMEQGIEATPFTPRAAAMVMGQPEVMETIDVVPTSAAVRSIVPEAAMLENISEPVVAHSAANTDDGDNIQFEAPDYSVFVIPTNSIAGDDYAYFVLLPRSKYDSGGRDGFLPVPPTKADGLIADFKLKLDVQNPVTLEQFEPHREDQKWSEKTLSNSSSIEWKANWDAKIYDDAIGFNEDASGNFGEGEAATLTLSEYLLNAYHRKSDGQIVEPDSLPETDTVLEDERVHNPSDNAYEAAVRGATEQFSGSPFFKHDPKQAYDDILDKAFKPETTIYDNETDHDKPEDERKERIQQRQQVHQVRSLVINTLIEDLQRYVDPNELDRAKFTETSVAFQMGLVFRVKRDELQQNPQLNWLTDNVGAAPQIAQRQTREATSPNEQEARLIRTFNTRQTSFATNPPQFQRVKHFTDANTIAITWDLVQSYADADQLTDLQKDPEQHLSHYEVRRRSLDGRDPETVYRVKGAAVLHKLHKGDDSILTMLKPRFQVVDHFTTESLEDVAALPAEGRSYLYSITPIDFAGNAGHPLTLVATRYPNEPPQVPVDAELQIGYQLTEDDRKLQDMGAGRGNNAESVSSPPLVMPTECKVTWKEPPPPKNGPSVAIDDYFLVFRRETTLPIGSYGLDSSTQQPRTKLLPTSNARPLQTDVKILLKPQGLPRERHAIVPLETLIKEGIFPPSQHWQPDSWKVYFQTVSTNGVPSALAPVQLLLRFQSKEQPNKTSTNAEERRPATLEWLPRPIRLALLPPEDQRAIVGEAHFPMPKEGAFGFNGSNFHASYQPHPARLRCIRFRWNQGPSHLPNYPLNLTSGYDLLQLDIDANTTETFEDPDKLANALRQIQDVQMMDAADQLLTPGDTLSTNRWEAWYPSMVQRRKLFEKNTVEGAEILLSPWYSWRDSILEWPEWPGLTDQVGGNRTDQLHPLLNQLIRLLSSRYIVDLQTVPPIQPQDFTAFQQSTASTADPYGWGILQRFGLSVTFSLRNAGSGEVIEGLDLLDELAIALDQLNNDPGFKHLFVELLVQQGRSINLEVGDVVPTSLLGMVQVSLRPSIKQVRTYGFVKLTRPAGSQVDLEITFTQSFSLINQADLSAGIAQFKPTDPGTITTIKHTLTMPLTGEVSLLMQGNQLPTSIVIRNKEDGSRPEVPIAPFEPTDNRSPYFAIAADQLAQDFSQLNSEAQTQWLRFKRYAESLNSTDPKQSDQDVSINVPTNGNALKAVLPEVLEWLQRFFDASGLVEATGLPWLATAYPRISTPAPVVPDSSGRLTYDHLLPDQWAHNYRFYIRPNNRYELLWQSLLQSPILFAQGTEKNEKRLVEEAQPDPEAAGLDVVLDRVRPIAAPVVLNSARLDPPTLPQQPVPPGNIWEVIVAQHREQALTERNQTLARQLSFRQVAFTLVRRFSQPTWVDRLTALMKDQGSQADEIEILLVENQYPALPDSYPNQLDHLDLSHLKAEQLRSLDIPNRIGNFQQGAMVLQWEALPFYYEHRLLLIAQTDKVVSPINSVTQQDFEYRSPKPTAIAQGTDALPEWKPPKPFDSTESVNLRARHLQLPLQRFWDSLPESAQAQWPSEEPKIIVTQHSPSALPDPDVVYQLIQIFGGNIEVQAEILLAPDKANNNQERYQIRQIGKSFFPQIIAITPPSLSNSETSNAGKSPLLESNPLFYTLNLALRQVSEVSLQRFYDLAYLQKQNPDIRKKLHFNPDTKILSVIDVFSREDLKALWLQSVEELRLLITSPTKALEESDSCRIVAQKLTRLPDGFDYLDINDAIGKGYTLLSLIGKLSDTDKQNLRALAIDCDEYLRDALLTLMGDQWPTDSENNPASSPDWGHIARSSNILDQPLRVVAVKPFEAFPSVVSSQLSLDEQTKTQISWQGAMTSEQAAALRARLFDRPITQLIGELQTVTVKQNYSDRQANNNLFIPDSLWSGTFKIEPQGHQWALVWIGEINADTIAQLFNLAPTGVLRTGIKTLVQQVLSSQKRHVNELSARVEQLRPVAASLSQISNQLANTEKRLTEIPATDPNRGQIEAEKARLEAQLAVSQQAAEDLRGIEPEYNAANQQLNAAIAKFRELTSDADANGIQAASGGRGSIGKTSFSTTVIWRLTQADVVAVLRARNFTTNADKVDQCLLIPEDPVQPMQWSNIYDLDAVELNRQINEALDVQNPLHQCFRTAFTGLVDKIKVHQTGSFDYRPQQIDCPEGARAQLILRGHLLRGQRPLDSIERNALLNLFAPEQPNSSDPEDKVDQSSALLQPLARPQKPAIAPSISAEVDQQAVVRLLNDLQDRQTLDSLYRRWLSQVTISPAFAEAVSKKRDEFPGIEIGYTLEWNQETATPENRLLNQENRKILQELQGDADFKEAIQRMITALDTQKPKVHREIVAFKGQQLPSLPNSYPSQLSMNWFLQYHGLMTVGERQQLLDLQPSEEDRIAVKNLFDTSMTESLRGGDLRIVTRRSSAKPSELAFINPQPL